MILDKGKEKFSRVVGISIAIQGLAWFCISVTGIVAKKTSPSLAKKDYSHLSYTEYLARIIYDNFLVYSAREKVIRPQDFEAFLWIYTVSGVVWVAAALDLNHAITFKKLRQSHSALALGVVVLLTSVIDLVFFSLLARDYSTCPFDLDSATTSVIPETISITTTTQKVNVEALAVMQEAIAGTPMDCKVASGLVMSVAARGYVLWLINVVTAVCLISFGTRVLQQRRILTYERNTIPRVKLPVPKNTKSDSASNDLPFYGDNGGFNPPPVLNSRPRSNNSCATPVVLSSKYQSGYF